MTAYFLLLQFLEEQQNLKCMKTIACEMVLKCKNPQVPAHIWVKVNLIYAKILIKNNKPGKAILVLKCMAKLLPPLPFANIPYTTLLKRAKNLQDLALAYSENLVSIQTYTYSTYKNSFITPMSDAREFSHKIIGEEAAPLPTLLPKYIQRRSERIMSEKLYSLRVYKKKKTQGEDSDSDNEEKKENTILGVSIPNLTEFKSLSYCSDPTFLYKIAKIASKYNICIHDGFCAIKDYIEFLKFEKDKVKREILLEKSEKLMQEIYQKIQESN